MGRLMLRSSLQRLVLLGLASFLTACGGGSVSVASPTSGTPLPGELSYPSLVGTPTQVPVTSPTLDTPLPRELSYASLDGTPTQVTVSNGQYSSSRPQPIFYFDGAYSTTLFKGAQALGDLGQEMRALTTVGNFLNPILRAILPLTDSQYFDTHTLVLVDIVYVTLVSRAYLRHVIEQVDRIELSYEICKDVPSPIGYPGYGPERSGYTEWFSIAKTQKPIVVLPLTLTKGTVFGQPPVSAFTGANC